MLLQVTLKAKWDLIEFPHYKWTECKQLLNARTGKIIKKTTNGKGVKAGYYINRKFIKIEDLMSKKLVQKIESKQTPF